MVHNVQIPYKSQVMVKFKIPYKHVHVQDSFNSTSSIHFIQNIQIHSIPFITNVHDMKKIQKMKC